MKIAHAATALLLTTACAPEPGSLAGPDPRQSMDHDHLTDHNWQLEIEGVTQGAFAEVSGLDSETEIIEYQDGLDLSLELVDWLQDGIDGRSQPRDLQLIELHPRGHTRYLLRDAQPHSALGGPEDPLRAFSLRVGAVERL